MKTGQRGRRDSRYGNHKCDICGKVYQRLDVYQCHLRIHNDIKPYECEICGKGFAHQGNRNQHQSTHSDVRDFKCKFCDKDYRTKIFLNRHMKQKHPEFYKPSKQGHVKPERRNRKAFFKPYLSEHHSVQVTSGASDVSQQEPDDSATSRTEDEKCVDSNDTHNNDNITSRTELIKCVDTYNDTEEMISIKTEPVDHSELLLSPREIKKELDNVIPSDASNASTSTAPSIPFDKVYIPPTLHTKQSGSSTIKNKVRSSDMLTQCGNTITPGNKGNQILCNQGKPVMVNGSNYHVLPVGSSLCNNGYNVSVPLIAQGAASNSLLGSSPVQYVSQLSQQYPTQILQQSHPQLLIGSSLQSNHQPIFFPNQTLPMSNVQPLVLNHPQLISQPLNSAQLIPIVQPSTHCFPQSNLQFSIQNSNPQPLITSSSPSNPQTSIQNSSWSNPQPSIQISSRSNPQPSIQNVFWSNPQPSIQSSNAQSLKNDHQQPMVQTSARDQKPMVQPSNQVEQPFAQPLSQNQKTMIQPSNQVEQPMVQPSNQVEQPMVQPSNQVEQPMVQPSNQVEQQMVQPSNQVEQPITQPSTQDQKSMAQPSTQDQKSITQPSTQDQKSLAQPSTQDQKSMAQLSTQDQKPMVQPLHQEGHQSNTTSFDLSCSMCGEKFTMRHKYQLHIMMHEVDQNKVKKEPNASVRQTRSSPRSHSKNQQITDKAAEQKMRLKNLKGFTNEELMAVDTIFSTFQPQN